MNADIEFEKFTNRKNKNDKRSNANKPFIFESPIDGFIGNFSHPHKIIEFVNKRYNIHSYKDAISKKAFPIKERGTNRFIGYVFPIRFAEKE